MTDPTASAPAAEVVEDDFDSPSVRLDREADAILQRDEMQSLGVRPLREALREDANLARAWGRERAGQVRQAVENEPLRSTAIALGIGVLIGLLAAR